MRKNVFYFKHILRIGGTEQFLYEIAKKYGLDYDIEVMYEVGDDVQIARLSKFVKCTKWKAPTIVECEKYFANFNLDQVPYVRAKEYHFCIHANFNEIGYKPNVAKCPKGTKFIGVSKWARDEFKAFTGKDATYCYNPLTLEPKEKVLHLVSACRLNDAVKGGGRTLALIDALDRYCEAHNRHYIWHIFTNQVSDIPSPNVCLMKPRIDVRPYIAEADYVLQLSNDMETYCYTLNEAWGYGVHTISTPLSIVKELPIPQGANKILEYDCSNVNEVARYIFENERKPFAYEIPKDDWGTLLAKGDSEYQKELKMRYRIKAIQWDNYIVDNQTKDDNGNNGRARTIGEEWIVDGLRLKTLQDCQSVKVEVVETIEDAKQEPKEVKKAVRRTTKKKSE